MMSDFRGEGGCKKTQKNRIKGGRGVKNDSKKSDIIYEWSLSKYTAIENMKKVEH